jgi:hypothetical protein
LRAEDVKVGGAVETWIQLVTFWLLSLNNNTYLESQSELGDKLVVLITGFSLKLAAMRLTAVQELAACALMNMIGLEITKAFHL